MEKQFNLELDSNGMVSSRDIHGFLGLSEKYSQWIKRWTKNYSYKEGRDFVRLTLLSTGGRPGVD
jgi:phage anti-repressor protein